MKSMSRGNDQSDACWEKLLFGWPSLLGWRPLLLGTRVMLVGRSLSLCCRLKCDPPAIPRAILCVFRWGLMGQTMSMARCLTRTHWEKHLGRPGVLSHNWSVQRFPPLSLMVITPILVPDGNHLVAERDLQKQQKGGKVSSFAWLV